MSTLKDKKPEYWMSMNQFEKGSSKIEKNNEFSANLIKEEFDVKSMPAVSRRKFMALLSASSAFAMASCNDYRDKGEIVTYNNKPEFATMGEAIYYASSLNDGQSVLVKTREGRPIKIDGNPDNPLAKGKITVTGHGEILNLYDPERITEPIGISESNMKLHSGKPEKIEWDAVDKDVVKAIKKAVAGNKEIAIITNSIVSPTQSKLFADFKAKYPTTKIYNYDFFSDNNRLEAWKACYSNIELPAIKWEKANIILALESDFLGNEGNVIEQTHAYASRRDVDNPNGFNRLYSVEGNMSQTGVNADYRLRLDPMQQYSFVMSIAMELAKDIDQAVYTELKNSGLVSDLKEFEIKNDLNYKTVSYLLKDLSANKGSAIVYAGDKLPKHVHMAVNYLNDMLGNDKLYNSENAQVIFEENTSIAEWEELVQNLNSGNVGLLVNFDSNPVFHLPEDLGFKEAYGKAETVISLVEMKNESSVNSKYILPINHALESWGDFNLRIGLLTLQQPVISPIYKTRQKEAILLNWMSDKPEVYGEDIYHKYLMMRWEAEVYAVVKPMANFRKFWLSTLHDGFLEYKQNINSDKTSAEGEQESENRGILGLLLAKKQVNSEGFTLILAKNYTIGDGRYANNGWVQELPHPVSKVAWDNYAAIAPKTAEELKVENNDVIEISIGKRNAKLPVIVQPGMSEPTVAVELGFGRTEVGEVGLNIGTNANVLLTKEDGLSGRIFSSASVKATGDTYDLVSTQEHHAVDDESIKDFHFKRDIIQEGTVDDYLKNPEFLHDKHHPDLSMSPPHEYNDIKWAMAIDLNKCTNCTNCVISCNVENNIPVVGKEQVGNGREMHWMRLDRYYSGTPEDPSVSIQPMLCSHCDKAPCENVCPVVATNHSPDGLNQMVYNRCVGTRYCANNCPFKVRRFNFFNFRSEFADGYYEKESVHLVNNPEVTVRSRGVMEKCTFCVQRISDAKQEALKEGKELKGSDVKTACQMACPADAIIFGNMNDPESKISKLREHNLSYHVLEILNINPNVTYIAKLKNKYTEDV